MRKLLVLSLLSAIFIVGYTQKPPIKFGDVTLDEVKMTQYDADPSASALVLTDFGSSVIDYNPSENWFKLNYERITRIKILTKDGYSQADFEVPIYHSGSSKEKLTGLKVVTHNLENGKVATSKIGNDAIFEEKYDQNTNIIKFTAPNVREGSVVEVTYKISSDFLQYLRDWDFQSTIPVLWSEYRTYIPEYFHYYKYTQGYVAMHVNESRENAKSFTITGKSGDDTFLQRASIQTSTLSYKENYNRYAVKDAPAFRNEPFMTTYLDYISRINFELGYYQFPNQMRKDIMGTWDDLVKTLLESQYFGVAVKGSGFLKKTAEEAMQGAASPTEKIAAIYNYVKSTIEWDGAYRKYLTDENLKDALDKKKGSSSHINLTLVSMLQKAGFNANPVILSTRNHGFVRENMALSSQFNYVIAQVIIDNKYLLLDATDRMLPMGILPERCLNGRGYVVSAENPGWIELAAPKTKTGVAAKLTLSDDGDINGQLKITSDGYAARKVRNAYFSNGEEEYVKTFSHGKPFSITRSEFKNTTVLDAMIEEHYEFELPKETPSPGTIYFSPIIYLSEGENPFKPEKREYPVNFGNAFERMFTLSLTLPSSYEIDEIPQSKAFSLPDGGGRYVYNVVVNGSTITITSILSVNKGLFSQLEYPNLREFYNLVVAKQAEHIVLKKKT